MIDHGTLFEKLCRIRQFEETVLTAFPSGVFSGTTHTYLGQEANAVGVLAQMDENDLVFSNHRCHGHFLAYGGPARNLFAELMGKPTGVCGGRGGSQHIHWRNFYSNGVLGSTIPVATGAALAENYKRAETVTIAFLGDGAFGEGVVYEALNMAALWHIPILYVVENNRIAQTTPVEYHLAGTFPARFQAFGIQCIELDTSDVLEIERTAGQLLDEVRTARAPRALILHTHRFGPHSKGDDTRSDEEVQALRRARDPIDILGSRLNPDRRQQSEASVQTEITAAFEQARSDPDHG